MTTFPLFEPGSDDMVVRLASGLMDGGLNPQLVKDVESGAAELGKRIKDYSIWFDSAQPDPDFGIGGSWMVAFHLERDNADRT